nr:DNA replication and repair protein RecF [Thiorhodococcus minor]
MEIHSLRNLGRVMVETDASAWLVTGANGAGKTTFLEAAYLLARGKTFRGLKAGPVCARGAERMLIRGDVETREGELGRIRVERDREGMRRETDPISWLDGGSAGFPFRVKLVSENPQMLLEGSPELRRRFLDLGVFHVEPRFGASHRRYRRILAQRNAELRTPTGQVEAWDSPFVEASHELHAFREAFVRAWKAAFRELARHFEFLDGCDLRYAPGWSGEDLGALLVRHRAQEIRRGFSVVGPSRADVYLARGSERAVFSRGQAKVVVTLLQLAAERVHIDAGCEAAVLLLDDLASELDEETASLLWALVSSTRSQILATGVAVRPRAYTPLLGRETAMFHVEHGDIRSVLT